VFLKLYASTMILHIITPLLVHRTIPSYDFMLVFLYYYYFHFVCCWLLVAVFNYFMSSLLFLESVKHVLVRKLCHIISVLLHTNKLLKRGNFVASRLFKTFFLQNKYFACEYNCKLDHCFISESSSANACISH